MSDKTIFEGAAPILAAIDVAQSVEFYEQKLGFKTNYNDGGYLIFQRENLIIHLSHYDMFNPATNPFTCYIYVENIEPLYEEYRAKNAIHPNGPLEVKPWNIKEFSVLDNNGNCLRFGERL